MLSFCSLKPARRKSLPVCWEINNNTRDKVSILSSLDFCSAGWGGVSSCCRCDGQPSTPLQTGERKRQEWNQDFLNRIQIRETFFFHRSQLHIRKCFVTLTILVSLKTEHLHPDVAGSPTPFFSLLLSDPQQNKEESLLAWALNNV